MYPQTFLAQTAPFPRGRKVFVAMSFLPQYTPRWENVLKPAIESVTVPTGSLEAHRVDLRNRGDSILTEILEELATARLLIVDISTWAEIDGSAVRNSNVFYELGIAHAIRLPEEVIVLRDDDDPLPFDIANVRVHSYSPDSSPGGAFGKIRELLQDALRETELRHGIAIQRAIELVDYTAWTVLQETFRSKRLKHPTHPDETKRFGIVGLIPRLAAIERLVALRAIRSSFNRLTPEVLLKGEDPPAQEATSYVLTEFGRTLYEACIHELGYFDPEVQAAIKIMPNTRRDDDAEAAR